MGATVRWLGCTTFLLEVEGLWILLDAYVNRVARAPDNGASHLDLTRLDAILIGHSHPHHCANAPALARASGAQVFCSPAAKASLAASGLAETETVALTGGERIRLSDTVTVRTFPSLHACDWMPPGQAAGMQRLDEDARRALSASERLTEAIARSEAAGAGELRDHLAAAAGDRWHGGVIAYLVEWPGGSLLFQDSAGAWSGLLESLRPQVAILAASGVPNLDGEPFQGRIDEFVAIEAAFLGWPTVIPCHHDDWMPPLTSPGDELEAILTTTFARMSASRLELPRYGKPVELTVNHDTGNDAGPLTAVCPVCEQERYSLYTSTDAEGGQTRLFCNGCATLPQYAGRIAGGTAQLLSIAELARWSLDRMLSHALSNERANRRT